MSTDREPMTTLFDIQCPNCDRVDTVDKIELGRYRCRECGHEFTQDDLLAPDCE